MRLNEELEAIRGELESAEQDIDVLEKSLDAQRDRGYGLEVGLLEASQLLEDAKERSRILDEGFAEEKEHLEETMRMMLVSSALPVTPSCEPCSRGA